MDYEQKYNEALARAKGAHNSAKSDKENGVTDKITEYTIQLTETIFPELKESEDEKVIRDIKVVLECSATKFFKEEGKMPIWYDRAVAWLEKQREKKHVDKVEPKFHEGDWVVSKLDRRTRQISEVHCDEYNKYYIVEGNDYNLEEYDRLHHLWTIQDAKDGDVLATKDNHICIFDNTVEDGKYPFAYCGLSIYGFEVYDRTLPFTHLDVYPATKEQCDLLFQRMKDAGYEWNVEKKELKKIEDVPENYKQQDMSEMTDRVKDYIQQKPAWSENDEPFEW